MIEIGGQSDVALLRRLLLKHARDAFSDNEILDAQWEELGYLRRPDLAKAIDEYDALVALLEGLGVGIDYFPFSLLAFRCLSPAANTARRPRAIIQTGLSPGEFNSSRLSATSSKTVRMPSPIRGTLWASLGFAYSLSNQTRYFCIRVPFYVYFLILPQQLIQLKRRVFDILLI